MKGLIKYFSITAAVLSMLAVSGCYYLEDRGNSDDPGSDNFIEDTTLPVPGDEGIILSTVTDDVLSLSWTEAADDITPVGELKYAVYQSASKNIETIDACETNGTLVRDYTANLTEINTGQVTYGNTYYFNIVVMDIDGNKQVGIYCF